MVNRDREDAPFGLSRVAFFIFGCMVFPILLPLFLLSDAVEHSSASLEIAHWLAVLRQVEGRRED
jgi:hypothetical protein